MDTEVIIKILMSESSSNEEVKLIQDEIGTFLYSKGLKPKNITCRSGSTELAIQFVVESIAKGALGAIGALFFTFVYKKIVHNNQDLNENLIEESKQDYIKTTEIAAIDGENELPEVLIDDELLLLRLIARSPDVTYTLAVTKDDGQTKTVTQYEVEISNSQVKKYGKSEYQYFE